jgi:glycosyltransferase involved in cell wall biosynthesis
MKKLAIVTSHPIQYNAPFFKLLSERKRITIKVFYTWGKAVLEKKYDPGFDKIVEWDIPLLEGYEYSFITNIAKSPGSGHFMGIDNPGLIDEIRNYDPSALLVFGWNYKSHLQCLRYFHNKMTILFRGDSTLLDKKGGIKKIARTLFLKWVYRHIDFALYAGINNKNYFKRHGLKDGQLVLAPHAIDNERFALPHEEYTDKAAAWKKELGITRNELTVLYAGKLKHAKNPFFIIELANQLQDLPIKFIIVGNGPLENVLKEKAKNNKQVIFLDFQNQSLMPVVYRLGDIFILPSKAAETWGLGANEAMASGCALALSEKVGGAIDLVPENKNGFVFALDKTKSCADLIVELSGNRDKLVLMKRASIELAQNFTFTKVAESIENILI